MNNDKYTMNLIEDHQDWDSLLEKLDTSCTYMHWSWGEYKKNYKWDIKRFSVIDVNTGHAIACFQLQSKRKGFMHIHLIQGGIHLLLENKIKNIYDTVLKVLQNYIKNKSGFLWILFNNYYSHNFDEADVAMMKFGFTPILSTKMFTYLLYDEDVTEDGSLLSQNWRHNLKRAKKNENLKIYWATKYEDRLKVLSSLSEMYLNLTNHKNFIPAYDFNYASDILASDKKILISYAHLKDKIVAIRVASVCNDHILDLIAASNNGAIKSYANYLLTWEMIMKMKKYKKKFFDTGGIDPASNLGVYNFKKGLNGKLAINGPLWTLGSHPIIGWVAKKIFI